MASHESNNFIESLSYSFIFNQVDAPQNVTTLDQQT